jgi:hypothetical protein
VKSLEYNYIIYTIHMHAVIMRTLWRSSLIVFIITVMAPLRQEILIRNPPENAPEIFKNKISRYLTAGFHA